MIIDVNIRQILATANDSTTMKYLNLRKKKIISLQKISCEKCSKVKIFNIYSNKMTYILVLCKNNICVITQKSEKITLKLIRRST